MPWGFAPKLSRSAIAPRCRVSLSRALLPTRRLFWPSPLRENHSGNDKVRIDLAICCRQLNQAVVADPLPSNRSCPVYWVTDAS